MFVQVSSGQAVEGLGLRQQFERWAVNVRPGAVGCFGGTAGITSLGRFIAVVRFEDEAAALANSQRSEQAAWWEETSRFLDGDVLVRGSEDIDFLGPGGSDDAEFVQVIEGQTTDRTRFMDLERRIEDGFAIERPDFMGSLLVWWPGGRWLEVAYFKTEAETRAAEQKGHSHELDELFAKWQMLAAPSSYLDLTEPWPLS